MSQATYFGSLESYRKGGVEVIGQRLQDRVAAGKVEVREVGADSGKNGHLHLHGFNVW